MCASNLQQLKHATAVAVAALLATTGKVLLLTNPVVAGYAQNPISVYFCYDAAGKLAKAISEVGHSSQPCVARQPFDPHHAVCIIHLCALACAVWPSHPLAGPADVRA
jgi:DUF1365 family protein